MSSSVSEPLLSRSSPPPSISTSPTTPKLFTYLFPILTLLTHILFLYSQIQTMWYLLFTLTLNAQFTATTWQTKLLFQALDIPNPLIFTDNFTHFEGRHVYDAKVVDEKLEEFTYGAAIRKLWKAEGLGKDSGGAKFGALILVMFSGIWPHLKLILLQIYYFKKEKVAESNVEDVENHVERIEAYNDETSLAQEVTATVRTQLPRTPVRDKMLYWISVFGKYSIADVFLVVVLMSVCNLSMPIEPKLVLKRIEQITPQIVKVIENSISENDAINDVCNTILQLNCTVPHNYADHNFWQNSLDLLKVGIPISCKLCIATVTECYSNPSILGTFIDEVISGIKAEGSGIAALRIAGVSGLHVFCVAVLSSLILGLVVDMFNHKAKAHLAKKETKKAISLAQEIEENEVLLLDGEKNKNQEAEQIFSDIRNIKEEVEDGNAKALFFYQVLHPSYKNMSKLPNYLLLILITVLTLFVGVRAVRVPSMKRIVPGSIPNIINETLFFDFEERYSLYNLVDIIGQKGGWDYFLKLLFAFFCIYGPLLRISLILLQLTIPLKKIHHIKLLNLTNNLGVFCALDVLFIALGLVLLELTPITNTIIHQDSKFCTTLRAAGYPESCLEIILELHATFFYAIFFFTATSLLTLMMIKMGFKSLNPYNNGDSGGPYFR